MRVVTELPYAIREVENVFVPLRDGTRLAARMWLPETAESVPAVLEYIPYRKRDRTRERDEPMHRYFAGHGYAAVRVDLRGTGDSDGLLADEYHDREIEDALEVLRWLADQPWCSGRVGMMGKSWGGFNALQVAARRPPQLGAVVSVCASDDRYADDAHYMGGCLLGENLIWGSALFTLAALPPDPDVVGERWRSLWTERLSGLPLFAETWMRHPARDDYWRRGSVCEEYASVTCPVFAVGGWADAYANAVPRLLQGLSGPRRGLVGPWAHVYPHEGVPGPAIGFLQETLRFWDRWLAGIDNGLDDDPMYRVWMQESVPPFAFYDERPGRWVAETSWPSPRIEPRTLSLAEGRLAASVEHGEAAPLFIRSPLSTGLASGSWCSFGAEGEMPRDQREDDGKSLTFDSAPLDARLEILGAPVVRLRLAADRPAAMVAARLNDVSPDGASTRVTYGLLNLAYRDGLERAEPLEPGRDYDVTLRMNDVAHGFAVGHRLRLSLSTVYWPLAWPMPRDVTLAIHASASELTLPVRPPRDEDGALPSFAPPESAPGADTVDLHPGGTLRTIEREATTGAILHTVVTDATETGEPALTRIAATGVEHGHAVVERFRVVEGDPLSARGEVLHDVVFRRGAWRTRVVTRTRLSGDATRFRLEAELEAYEGGRLVYSKSWDRRLPRESL